MTHFDDDTLTTRRSARGDRAWLSEPPSLLVVDDDDDLRDALGGLLEDSGYRVTTTANGVEALRVLSAGLRPDVIVLDLMMPESDGYDFRARQRKEPAITDIPSSR